MCTDCRLASWGATSGVGELIGHAAGTLFVRVSCVDSVWATFGALGVLASVAVECRRGLCSISTKGIGDLIGHVAGTLFVRVSCVDDVWTRFGALGVPARVCII